MTKLTKILSFSDYASGKTPVEESAKVVPTQSSKVVAKPSTVPSSKPKAKPVLPSKRPVAPKVDKKPIKESAFIVGDDYKVKLVLDIPQSVVNEYIAKVKKDTGKDALTNFTAEEIAEEMVKYIVKTKLSIENLPASLSVGEQAGTDDFPNQEGEEIEFDEDGADVEQEQETEITEEPSTEEDDPFKDETEEFELDDEDDDTDEVKSGDANDKMSFKATEVEDVEKNNIQLDAEQTV